MKPPIMVPVAWVLLSLAGCTPPEDTGLLDADGDGYTEDQDCDDADPEVYPGAPEQCDGVDDNCNGQVDEFVGDRWYEDADGDGYGSPKSTVEACSQPAGWVADGSDCDDGDASIHPGGTEVCNGEDDDCDGDVDGEAVDAGTWYLDLDEDGWGDPEGAVTACTQPGGTVDDDQDCDDGDGSIHPGAPERCNGVDDDCDGATDEDDAVDRATWYQDDDGDGWGITESALVACGPLSGWTLDPGDCDDGDASVHPDADEYCDAVDQDCDGEVAEADALDAATWHPDADGDGYGDEGSAVVQCWASGDLVADGTDCDDGDDGVNPGADESCDGVDDDCDGTVDEDDAIDATTWYQDADGDTWGDPASTHVACEPPAGFVEIAGDCDDANALAYPEALDLCGDGVDADCGGSDSDCPAPGELLITEIMKDPAALADSSGEWFEIYNASGSSFDLQGLLILDEGGEDWQIDTSFVLDPGAFAVLARDPLATTEADLIWSGFLITNISDQVIVATWGTDGTDGTVIHEIAYDNVSWPDVPGASLSLDPSAFDPVLSLDPTWWCPGQSAYDTGDLGTPGTMNPACP